MGIRDIKKKVDDHGSEFKDVKETSETIFETREREMREMGDLIVPDDDIFQALEHAKNDIKSEAKSDHADRVGKVNDGLQKDAQDARADVTRDEKETEAARTKMERVASDGAYGASALRDASSKADQRSKEYSDLSKRSESDSRDAKRVVESDAQKLQS